MATAQERNAAEVEELARRALVIREEERRHLAHELHDEMGQSISAIKALAVSISRRADPHDPKIKQSADTIAEVSTRVYDRVRQMMSQLRPTTLDELGLVRALEDMIDTWNSHHENVFCGFSASSRLPHLSATQRINLFRIVQEALTNVAKHAGATNASVVLEYTGDGAAGEILLRIRDDGAGFDIRTQPRGLGLVGIHERVRALGGKITLASHPENGTQFEISVPLSSKHSSISHEQDSDTFGG
jgi:two-component system sensor histidine kinase UhpB